MTRLDRRNQNLIDRMIKAFRTALCYVVPFFALLVIWFFNFDVVRRFLFKILSERTISFIRLVLQYLLGTESVAMSLQILLSYSFIFIGTFSFAVVLLKIARVFLSVSTLYTKTNTQKQNHSSQSFEESFHQIFLVYSKLNI